MTYIAEAVPRAPLDDAIETLSVRGWREWIGPGVSLAIVVAALFAIDDVKIGRVWAMVPVSPLFWMVFVAAYLVQPASEWIIYRRLWSLPARGLVPLLRKQAANELLLGYAGEAYFYGWARRNAGIVAAPFGAIKDVAILSALTGNAATLAMLAIAWPWARTLHLTVGGDIALGSVAIVVITSLAMLAFRRSLFSLDRRDLHFIATVHLARIATVILLAGWMWHFAVPSIAIGSWVLLATLRMLVSRLPLTPDKDLVFAGLAAFLIGGNTAVADLLTMMATLILGTHVVIGGALGLSELVGVGRGSRR